MYCTCKASVIQIEIIEKAASQVFSSAQAITNDVLIDQIESSTSVESLQHPIALYRSGNRKRFSPRDPSTFDFAISHDILPAGFLRRDLLGIAYRHIIFASAPVLELLARAKVWYLDATFKLERILLVNCFQFVKHGRACIQVPLVFVLM